MGDKRRSGVESLPSSKRRAEEEMDLSEFDRDLLKFKNKHLGIRTKLLQSEIQVAKNTYEQLGKFYSNNEKMTSMVSKFWSELVKEIESLTNSLYSDSVFKLGLKDCDPISKRTASQLLQRISRGCRSVTIEEGEQKGESDDEDDKSRRKRAKTDDDDNDTGDGNALDTVLPPSIRTVNESIAKLVGCFVDQKNLLVRKIKFLDEDLLGAVCDKAEKKYKTVLNLHNQLSEKMDKLVVLHSLSQAANQQRAELEVQLKYYRQANEQLQHQLEEKRKPLLKKLKEEQEEKERQQQKDKKQQGNDVKKENEKGKGVDKTLDAYELEPGEEPPEEMDKRKELEYFTQLTENRLGELNRLIETFAKTRSELDILKVQNQIVPDSVVTESIQYKKLLSQNIKTNKELQDLRTECEEMRKKTSAAYETYKTSRRVLEDYEKEETGFRTKILDLENEILQKRNELEECKQQRKKQMELDHSAKNITEINQEMRTLVASLTIQTSYLDKELERLKAHGATLSSNLDNDTLEPSLLNPLILRNELLSAFREKNQAKIEKVLKTVSEISPQLKNKEQEEETLMLEMENLMQDFDKVQEQNTRLSQQLKDKEESNRILLEKHMKSHKLQQAAREEANTIAMKMESLHKRYHSSNEQLKILETKQRQTLHQLKELDKEMPVRQHNLEVSKKKAIEQAQACFEMKTLLTKSQSDIEILNKFHEQKVAAISKESGFKKRLVDETANLEKKIKQYKNTGVENYDNILKEQVAGYKEFLNCSLCKRRKKDTILTKCFHAFCSVCIQERYESRRRKCPNCLDPFGNNDFHKFTL